MSTVSTVRLRLPLVLLILFLAGCGTIATPEPIKTATPLPTDTKIPPTATSTFTPTQFPTSAFTATATQLPPSPVPATPTEAMSGMSGMGGDTSASADITLVPHDGDPVQGKVLFEKGTGNASVPACSACHSVDTEDVKVGPSLKEVGTHAKMHADEHHEDVWTFLRSSITDPNEDIMEAEPPHVFGVNGVSLMYQNYGKDLTKQQIDDITAYLMTLK